MSSKTQKVVRRFVHTDPEWYPDVMETKDGYTVICAREKRGLKEYGSTLSTFKYKKRAEKAANTALETRNKMLALAYP